MAVVRTLHLWETRTWKINSFTTLYILIVFKVFFRILKILLMRQTLTLTVEITYLVDLLLMSLVLLGFVLAALVLLGFVLAALVLLGFVLAALLVLLK